MRYGPNQSAVQQPGCVLIGQCQVSAIATIESGCQSQRRDLSQQCGAARWGCCRLRHGLLRVSGSSRHRGGARGGDATVAVAVRPGAIVAVGVFASAGVAATVGVAAAANVVASCGLGRGGRGYRWW